MSSILSASDISDIVGEITSLIGDDTFSTTINYQLTGTTVSTWSPTTALIPNMYTVSSVSAFKTSLTLEEIEEYNSRFRVQKGANVQLEVGDLKFIIMTSSVTGILSVDDMIYESSSTWQSATTYQIKMIKRDPLEICYFIGARMI